MSFIESFPLPVLLWEMCDSDDVTLCSAVSKVQQLLQGLQASGDEGQQLTAVMEMCQVSRFHQLMP